MLLSLALTACGRSDEPPPKQPQEPDRPPQAPTAPPSPPTVQDDPALRTAAGGSDAAQIVRRYYALIEKRNYGEAYALREASETAPSLQAFAANFDRHAEFRVTVGTPSQPVQSGRWFYVEVPVVSYGRFKDGSPLASAGILTLRKPVRGDSWRIFTKG
jgi:hypothetical protein